MPNEGDLCCFCLDYLQVKVLRFINVLFDCVELFVTLAHVYIFFSMKCELLYGMFDGLKGFLNKAYCDSINFLCKAIQNANNTADNSLQTAFKS